MNEEKIIESLFNMSNKQLEKISFICWSELCEREFKNNYEKYQL